MRKSARGGGGDVLVGRVRDVTHAGEAVVETERGIVMARGGLPGERVRLRVTGRSRGVAGGRVLELLEPSGSRVEPACPLAARCGGCPLMSLELEAQLQWKREKLARVLAHAGNSIEPELVRSPRPLGYRQRARLAWRAGKGGATLGYRAPGASEVVDVERCLVLSDPLVAAYARLRTELGPLLCGEGEIALGLGRLGRCTAELTSDGPQPEQVYRAIERLVAEQALAGAALRIGREAAPALFGDARQHCDAWDGEPLSAPPGAFVQANPELNARLVARVRALAAPTGARVLELYAGHGNFTLALADASELVAVESNRAAADACRENLAARGHATARVVCAEAREGAQGRSGLDVVVLDPPRAGARDVLEVIVARRPQRIVYVSCDLGTLRRDLGLLVEAGYAIDAAAAFDMFPQTAHLESVVRLVRV